MTSTVAIGSTTASSLNKRVVTMKMPYSSLSKNKKDDAGKVVYASDVIRSVSKVLGEADTKRVYQAWSAMRLGKNELALELLQAAVDELTQELRTEVSTLDQDKVVSVIEEIGKNMGAADVSFSEPKGNEVRASLSFRYTKVNDNRESLERSLRELAEKELSDLGRVEDWSKLGDTDTRTITFFFNVFPL